VAPVFHVNKIIIFHQINVNFVLTQILFLMTHVYLQIPSHHMTIV